MGTITDPSGDLETRITTEAPKISTPKGFTPVQAAGLAGCAGAGCATAGCVSLPAILFGCAVQAASLAIPAIAGFADGRGENYGNHLVGALLIAIPGYGYPGVFFGLEAARELTPKNASTLRDIGNTGAGAIGGFFAGESVAGALYSFAYVMSAATRAV